MGTLGRSLVGKDVDQLIELMNKALADEWLAYYQYWMGAKVAAGPMRGAVTAELEEHAAEELQHAMMLVERILQLGGTPLLSPQDWFEMTNCGYEAPEDPYVGVLLEQNIAGEQCAIEVYKEMMDFTEGKDPVTYEMALEIMTDEIEHEEDLQALQEDMALMKERR
jgi:bacterioferritin